MNIESLSTLEINKLSQKQFDNAFKNEELNSTALYLTPDINAGEKTPEGGEIFNDYENNIALGKYSHTGGFKSKTGANAYAAFAHGDNNQADGACSVVFGKNTKTDSNYQFAIGCYNDISEKSSHLEPPIFMIGCGEADNSKNIFTVFKDGTARIGANPIDDMDIANKGYVDSKVSLTLDLSGYMPLTGGIITTEETPYAATINPDFFQMNYYLTGDSFVQIGADKEIGIDNTTYGTPKYSGYITLANAGYNEIPNSTFTITAISVEGNDTAKASWRQWLKVPEAGENVTIDDNNKINVDLEKLENSITWQIV